MKDAVWTVSQITRRIRALIDSDDVLQDVWLEGEVSDFHRARSKHIYFSLKDQDAVLAGFPSISLLAILSASPAIARSIPARTSWWTG